MDPCCNHILTTFISECKLSNVAHGDDNINKETLNTKIVLVFEKFISPLMNCCYAVCCRVGVWKLTKIFPNHKLEVPDVSSQHPRYINGRSQTSDIYKLICYLPPKDTWGDKDNYKNDSPYISNQHSHHLQFWKEVNMSSTSIIIITTPSTELFKWDSTES